MERDQLNRIRPYTRAPTAILRRIGPFLLQVLKSFRANQGFLLAGAVAYYTLLSIVPLFTLLLLVLSRVVDREVLVDTLTRLLNLVIPGETGVVVAQMQSVVEHGEIAGWLVLSLLFFSSMAFTILENAMSVIFFHRVAVRRRHFVVSALLPYMYILLLGAGLLVTTVMASILESAATGYSHILGSTLPLDQFTLVLLYLMGLGGEILLLTTIYMVMPVGRLSLRRALIGGVAAGLLWEATRRVLVWYFASLSLVNVVYGPLATTIVALLTLEAAALILLFGAQIIAEYERIADGIPPRADRLHLG